MLLVVLTSAVNPRPAGCPDHTGRAGVHPKALTVAAVVLSAPWRSTQARAARARVSQRKKQRPHGRVLAQRPTARSRSPDLRDRLGQPRAVRAYPNRVPFYGRLVLTML